MTLEGKGMFIWKVPRCEGGDPSAIAATAKSAGFSHVVLKIANGSGVYNGTWNDPIDYTTPVIEALRAQNIKVLGWHYVYGDDPIGEANVAIRRINQYNLDGYVIDAEEEYKQDGKKAAAKRYMNQLRSSLPDLDIALSSYRFPQWHMQIPWTEFLEKCTYNMPQVYWIKSTNPAEQLVRCIREFQNIAPFRPILPTGAAFTEKGWQPTAAEVFEFFKAAKSLNLSAINFWEWYDARAGIMPNVWEVIRDYPWSGVDAPKDICEKYIAALNSHDVNQMLALYASTAVHITAARTSQGLENLRNWYTQLFNQVLPNATFTLTGYSGSGNSRHLTWTATSNAGMVQNGNDTFGLFNDGKINYHYSFFTVTK
jgi:hypothetical protein